MTVVLTVTNLIRDLLHYNYFVADLYVLSIGIAFCPHSSGRSLSKQITLADPFFTLHVWTTVLLYTFSCVATMLLLRLSLVVLLVVQSSFELDTSLYDVTPMSMFRPAVDKEPKYGTFYDCLTECTKVKLMIIIHDANVKQSLQLHRTSIASVSLIPFIQTCFTDAYKWCMEKSLKNILGSRLLLCSRNNPTTISRKPGKSNWPTNNQQLPETT